MNSTNDYKDPSTRSFCDEIKALEIEELKARHKDIETYLYYGIRPIWTVIIDPSASILNVKYWAPEDLVRYRRILMVEQLDRCKSFELLPKLKFNF